MPIFEYKCTECNKIYEKILHKKKPETICPKCGKLGKPIINTIAKPKHSSDSWRQSDF